MAVERTLAIIKPDAVERNIIGEIIAEIEKNSLKIVAMKMIHLSKKQAEGFYYVHKDKPFFDSLTNYMSSGPIVVMVLEGENAIERWRKLMGATNPENAEEGTIRKRFGLNVEKNSVHGSDSPESAKYEISYFFNALEIVG
ncbi:nucleoside-diphosphate kinase [Thermosulfidibacter takaii ABI70S6]|uniref:Nucleoside diphosphate kinase n=1 Tax=Thermosulfidibacter takaii (strain DSM 17441 / JCM 13301 / NBRC 103674 / ABI70S6) TaxID=1298851 RepID=A0A0S3QS13_THET7|nr:nucleoside-diphosphate kinase [Thermosulfidibacter takaii]BAT71095.1 nucleoside-diphosphate kinase [Thermosulfidibacter takaii ABI70S6]